MPFLEEPFVQSENLLTFAARKRNSGLFCEGLKGRLKIKNKSCQRQKGLYLCSPSKRSPPDKTTGLTKEQ